jgi:NAD+ synthase (glutamine-hydrolysing)
MLKTDGLQKEGNRGVYTQASLPQVSLDSSVASKVVGDSLLKSQRSYKVAVAQISTDPGSIEKNTQKIIAYINEARQAGARLVVFPELTIPGYLSMDLLKRPSFLEQNKKALTLIRQATEGITAIVGFADFDLHKCGPDGRPLVYNSAAVIHDGKILAIQDKTLLPEYDIFFERRYFSAARPTKVIKVDGLNIGTEICEDLWSSGYDQDPTKKLAEAGADLIVNLSASPFHLGKLPVRHELIKRTATENNVPFIYANLIGSFDGHEGEVVFDGRSLIVKADGSLQAMGKGFKEDLVVVDVFGAQKMELPEVEEVAELHDALVLGIKDYFRRLGASAPNSFKKAVIGLSGGIDSALVAALAVEALGPDRVLGITMPSRFNKQETKLDAQILAENLGIEFRTSPIEESFNSEVATFRSDPDIAKRPADTSEENIQARIRMMRLMAYANKLGGVVLNTGNRTELALDNMTIYGDMVGGFSVLGDVDKDRVFALSRYINKKAGREIIPQSTIDRVPTAELKENQTDAMVMGDDPQKLAPMMREVIEGDLCFSEALGKFREQFSEELIASSFRRLDRSEWKRRQASPAIRVTKHTFGDGRRVPIGHGFLG